MLSCIGEMTVYDRVGNSPEERAYSGHANIAGIFGLGSYLFFCIHVSIITTSASTMNKRLLILNGNSPRVGSPFRARWLLAPRAATNCVSLG